MIKQYQKKKKEKKKINFDNVTKETINKHHLNPSQIPDHPTKH